MRKYFIQFIDHLINFCFTFYSHNWNNIFWWPHKRLRKRSKYITTVIQIDFFLL